MSRRAMSPELQEARGNPGKRKTIKQVVPKVAGRVVHLVRPDWLTDELAKKIWGQLQASLHFLRPSDVHVFARYCVYLSNWVHADGQIGETGGSVYETSSAHVENMMRINPWFTVRSRLEDDLVKIEEKIGLTPLDRQRIMVGLANANAGRIGDLFSGGVGEGEDAEDGADEGPPELPAPPAEEVATVGGLRRRLDG